MIDFNFYPEKQTETLEALPKIVLDCDLTGWTFSGLVSCAVEADHMLWRALYSIDEDGNIRARWR